MVLFFFSETDSSNNSTLNLVICQILLHEILVAKLITIGFTHFHATVKWVRAYKQSLMKKGSESLLSYIGASFYNSLKLSFVYNKSKFGQVC